MLQTLDHVVIGVRDLAAATTAYQALLGRRPSWRGSHPAYGTANTLFRLGASYLELLSPVGDGALSARLEKRLAAQGEGLSMLAFGSDDADALVRKLRARGIAASDPAAGEGREAQSGALRRWRNVFLSESDTRGVPIFAIEHLSPPDALPVAELDCAAGAAVSEFDHVVVQTEDADAARVLYGDKLGIRLALDRSFEQRGVRLLFFRIGGVTIELAARLGAPTQETPDRLWGLAYRVPDVDAAHARLRAAGFELSGVRDGNKPGTRVCTVKAGTCGVPTLLIAADARSA